MEQDTIKAAEHPQRRDVIYGAPEGQDALHIIDRARALMASDAVMVHVCIDSSRIETLKELIAFFAPDVRVVTFRAWDCLPYDRVSPHSDIVAGRVAALTQILAWDTEKKRYPRVVLTSVNAMAQRVMPRDALRDASLSAHVGGQLDMEAFQAYLVHNGYHRNDTVREAGEYAIRGGIVDIFPAGFEQPLRLDLFGDEIEKIKAFDPITQVTDKDVESFSLTPVTEFFLDDASIARFRSAYREAFGVVQNNDPLYEAVSEGRRYNGMEHWLPLFYDKMDTLLDYMPQHEVSLDHHADDALVERLLQVKDFYDARSSVSHAAAKSNKGTVIQSSAYNPLPIDVLYVDHSQWRVFTDNAADFSPFAAPDFDGYAALSGKKGRSFSDVRALPDGDVFAALKSHIFELQKAGRAVFVVAYSDGSRDRLKALCDSAGIPNTVTVSDCDKDFKAKKKKNEHGVFFCVMPLENGFVNDNYAFITEQDILGDRLARKQKKSRKNDNFLREVSALSDGDLVVHIDHGVGRFIALETIAALGVVNDCLKIEYAGGDKLYVPVINLDVLSRFGSDSETTLLDKLGGAGWQARKAKAKKNLMEMADKLLGIAAARQLKKAPQLQIGVGLYEEFASRFPYTETEDQERSIASVLDGMGGAYPMDHLVCGDVGFGKTEVALRAAYVAAMSGVQVAVVVPTTLLARQHYANFEKRFAGTGIRLGQLSRMVSAKEAEQTRKGLRDGTVQIVIGTHALFADKVKFDTLGLVIVDEEQRFGVKQKEKLKAMQSNVHVLTLTATPIPRTLQMSLTGVKEMSLITTPPVDRLAIRTFVMPLDTVVIRDAILREHYRGGQSFYVVPRIKDLKEISDMLAEIVPEVKVVEAHGQLSATELDDRMTAFSDGQYHVLLATNIIESGIDIPTANTMIVHRADMFGLSQLYQIRGRIGRAKVRAYAYLTYKANAVLNPNAQKRLEVMETLDTLGAGFQLASHDMDIRGAGNLLGDAQSGHIREVGVELYQQMLEEAVAAAKAGIGEDDYAVDESWSPQINLGASVLIPENYVPDLSVRMSLYRRMNDLDDARDVERFAAELIDRFGALPPEVENLMQTLKIKNLCKIAHVSHIDAGPKGTILAFHGNNPPNVDGLMQWIGKKAGTVKIRPDQKISVIRNWPKPQQRMRGVETLMTELAAVMTAG